MDAAEAAVAHHQHMVAGARRLRDGLDEFGEVLFGEGALTERRQRFSRVPAEIGRITKNPISIDEAAGQRVFHHTEFQTTNL